jgi:hypothetical protein
VKAVAASAHREMVDEAQSKSGSHALVAAAKTMRIPTITMVESEAF